MVNQYGQTWAVPNLFIMDGATMVSSPDKNPTLSIIALAWRSADNMATIAKQGALMSDAPETPEPYVSKIDRRTALAWIGVVGAATAVGAGVVVYGPKMGGERITRGYGTDPKLTKPEKAPWSRIMIAEQLQTAAILADFILPASGAAPSASSLGIPDFVDEWVSAPYPDQVKDRPVVMNGLNALGAKRAEGQCGRPRRGARRAAGLHRSERHGLLEEVPQR